MVFHVNGNLKYTCEYIQYNGHSLKIDISVLILVFKFTGTKKNYLQPPLADDKKKGRDFRVNYTFTSSEAQMMSQSAIRTKIPGQFRQRNGSTQGECDAFLYADFKRNCTTVTSTAFKLWW